MSTPLVVAIGEATLALHGSVSRFPDEGARAELDEVSLQVGGAATVAAVTAVSLGCEARLVTSLADDSFGGFIANAITRAGVSLRAVRPQDARMSGVSIDLRSHHKHVAYFTRGDIGALDPAAQNLEALLADASALMVDGMFPAAQIKAAEAARLREIPVVFDGTTLCEGVGELVGLADVLITSERLASELAPRGELADSLIELQRLGPGAVIITLGAAGSIGLHGDRLVEQGTFDVDVVDATGAGGVYHGAFVAALLSKLPFARCMELASAAAALSCRVAGAWAGIPERDEVLTLLGQG